MLKTCKAVFFTGSAMNPKCECHKRKCLENTFFWIKNVLKHRQNIPNMCKFLLRDGENYSCDDVVSIYFQFAFINGAFFKLYLTILPFHSGSLFRWFSSNWWWRKFHYLKCQRGSLWNPTKTSGNLLNLFSIFPKGFFSHITVKSFFWQISAWSRYLVWKRQNEKIRLGFGFIPKGNQ